MLEALRRGLVSFCEEGGEEFDAFLVERNLEEDQKDAFEAIFSVPDVLDALNQVTLDDKAPMGLRSIFPAMMGYLLSVDDMIPSEQETRVLGLLDDAYLVHLVAQRVSLEQPTSLVPCSEHLLGTLQRILPSEVITSLTGWVDLAFEEAMRQATRFEEGE